ncbi:MAG: hypothetical protein IPK63_18750 [Candidatus Competibacteraceae bacterium]|nr:hypothetical protein [Candidatus Competibacteraceae bacterium]
MGTLSKPDRATYFVAHGPNATHTGITEPNQVTVTGQPSFETAADENEYLGLLAPVATAFPPLPAAGTPLTQGDIYLWGAIAVMVRQSHIRTEHDPDTVPALFIIHRLDDSIDWIADEQVNLGTRRTFNGVLYQVIQPHVTQSDWTPPTVPALWKVVEEQGGGGTTWVDTGATITSQTGQLFYVSLPIAGLGLTAGQAIRIGQTLETTFVQVWPGTTTLMQINPYVAATAGMKVFKWA